MCHRILVALTLCVAGLAPGAGAAQGATPAAVASALAESFPGITPSSIRPAPVPGFYEVSLGGNILYVTADGHYLFTGKLFDLHARRDLTEPALAKLRLKVLRSIPEDRMIVFEPSGETRYTITTFTDIDCPYCRRMQRDIKKLMQMGIRVRYLFYPRAGVDSDSYDKAVSVWCAKDRKRELTRALAGWVPPKRSCDNPVREHMRLAEEVGLEGTPMTITATGEEIRGYVGARALLARLEGAAHATADLGSR
jgi:thiol:disulfide interchange protein DsbC